MKLWFAIHKAHHHRHAPSQTKIQSQTDRRRGWCDLWTNSFPSLPLVLELHLHFPVRHDVNYFRSLSSFLHSLTQPAVATFICSIHGYAALHFMEESLYNRDLISQQTYIGNRPTNRDLYVYYKYISNEPFFTDNKDFLKWIKGFKVDKDSGEMQGISRLQTYLNDMQMRVKVNSTPSHPLGETYLVTTPTCRGLRHASSLMILFEGSFRAKSRLFNGH